MKLNRWLVVVGLCLACMFEAHDAEARGPSTPEERSKVVKLARWLEQNPLAENAPATRQWLQEWIADVPDIRFKMCADLLGHALGDNYSYSREVNQQMLFSGAAFTLERQDKARDDIAVYHAGVEGALRMYQVLVRSKPDAKLAFLDDLVAKRDHDQLVDYVDKEAKERCKRSNILLIAAPAGAAVGLVLALLIARSFGRRRTDDGAEPERLTLGRASRRIASISQRIVLSCVAYYVTIGIALHFLEPEYDPRFRFMSEYAWGAYGWLMTTTFFVLGLALVTVAVGLREVHQSYLSARIGIGLLLVGSLGVSLAGVFREFIPHAAAGAVGLPSIVIAALILSWGFRWAEGWQPIHRKTLLIALGMLVAFLSIVVDVGMPGLQQRVFLGLVLLWVSVVVHRLAELTRVFPRELQPTKNTTQS
jgi:hypothetical membrane protein